MTFNKLIKISQKFHNKTFFHLTKKSQTSKKLYKINKQKFFKTDKKLKKINHLYYKLNINHYQ
jgi:hypothetical protein